MVTEPTDAVVMEGEFGITDRRIAASIYLTAGIMGTYLCTRRLHALPNALPSPRPILYIHLYLANLSISLCSLCAGVAAYQGGWQFGHLSCQVYATVAFFGGMAAILMTSLLAAEAYIAIYWKQAYASLTSTQYHAASLVVWLNAAFWAVAPLVGWSSYSLEPVGVTCEISWLRSDPNHVSYLTALIGFGFAIPFGIAGFLLFLCWCGHQNEEQDSLEWMTPSDHHQNAILKASTLHLCSSLLAWGPYSIVCLLPFFIPHLPLPSLVILAPSITTKLVLAFQGLILPLCSGDLWDYQSGKFHTA